MSGLYGIKDMGDIVLIDKSTGYPALTITYANSASLDVTSESVFAQIRGTNAIRWDAAKNATLTLESELFEMGYLAMLLGADVAEGRSDIFHRVEGVINDTRAVKIGDGVSIRPETISVIRLAKAGSVEHTGLPLHNGSAALRNLPGQVHNVTVSINDTSAKIDFQNASGADKYVILRDESVVAETEGSNYTDTGLTPDTLYEYKVYAINSFGKGPASAVVEVTTASTGTLEYTQFLASSQARNEAANNTGEVATPDVGVAYTFENGVIKFNEEAVLGDAYAIYFLEETEDVRVMSIDSDKFAGSYEIFANAMARTQENGTDDLLQFHFMNAKPQTNFTLSMSSDAPTTLSVVFDLMPVPMNGRNALADIKVVR